MSAASAGSAMQAPNKAAATPVVNLLRFMTVSSRLCFVLPLSLRSGRGEETRDEPRKAAHDHVTRYRIRLEHLQCLLAVDSQQRRLFQLARARDALRMVFEQRCPAEHLAFPQHEPGGIHALVAPDLEFHAPGFEHEKVLGRVAE